MKKVILHLCADIGSDSRYYQLDDNYKVIKIGIDVGVENFSAFGDIHGVIANPVCTEFSTAGGFDKVGDLKKGMILVDHCLRIIKECNPKWWVLENPKNGRLKEMLGKPDHSYQPWSYGSPWTKSTALWCGGDFKMPETTVKNRSDTVLREGIYIRPRDTMPSLAILHKSAINFMPEYEWARHLITCDSDLRSLCSDGFAKAMYEANP